MGERPDRDAAAPLDVGRRLALLYSPPSERPVLEALLAVESEIGASLQSGLDHNVAHLRLQWWRDECERVGQGSPAHPLTRTLVREFSGAPPGGLEGLSGLVDVAVWDLAAATFETRRELSAYCERWAAAMVRSAVLHATPGANDTRAWLTIGGAIREVQLLADLDTDARAGRLRVPLDELERAGVQPDSLGERPHSPQLTRLLAERHAALRSILAQSITSLASGTQPVLRGLLVWAATTWRRSQQLQRALPSAPVPRRREALADAWHAWRTARHAMEGKLRLTIDSH